MNESDRPHFARMLQAVFEVYNAPLTRGAVDIWWAALLRHPLESVRKALNAHVQTAGGGHFAPRPADIIEQVQSQDGRPGAEEAWAMIPKDEAGTVVWTAEMAQAFAVALRLIEEGDLIAGRMAFLEHYRKAVQSARAGGVAVRWTPSLGHDPNGREAVLLAAASKGLLEHSHIAGLLPHRDESPALLRRLGL